MNTPQSCVRLQAWFEGRVQGVGFRYHAAKIAREYEIVGHVENLPDGRVHLLIEGREDQAEAFLSQVCDDLGHFIKKTQVDSQKIDKPQCKGFALR